MSRYEKINPAPPQKLNQKPAEELHCCLLRILFEAVRIAMVENSADQKLRLSQAKNCTAEAAARKKAKKPQKSEE